MWVAAGWSYLITPFRPALFRALASGARGFIVSDLNSLDLSKVVKAVDQGEIWISRKMQGKIMEQIVIAFQHEMREESL